jgi:hypothetical protein
MRSYVFSYGSLVVAAGLALFLEHVSFQPYLFLCGGALSGLGFWIFYRQIAFLKESRVARGELVDWKEVPRTVSRTPRIDYYAVVEFEDGDGRSHRVTGATGTWPKPRTPMGTRYAVRYSPENPEEARLDTVFDYWGPAVIILMFGAGVIVISFYAAHSR